MVLALNSVHEVSKKIQNTYHKIKLNPNDERIIEGVSYFWVDHKKENLTQGTPYLVIASEAEDWLYNNCEGAIYFTGDYYVYFESLEDASLFKLTWC